MFYRYRAKVLRVVDGDTIDFEIDLGFNVLIRERVRLYGINAPETRTRDKKEKEAGEKAEQFVIEKLQSWTKEIEIVTFKDRKGKFGRYLAVIYYRGLGSQEFINLNQEMLDNGLAKKFMEDK